MSVNFSIRNQCAIITLENEGSSVNVLDKSTILCLSDVIGDVEKKKDIKALIIHSHKKNCFVAGADIKEIEDIKDPKEGIQKAKIGQDLMNQLEDLSIVTVAVINGVALGGGCELALACDWRIATFNPKVMIGLPEINLGFVPGFGGTYRLPRLVGVQQGLKMILSGCPISAKQALRIGLVDKIISEKDLENSVDHYVKRIVNGEERKPVQRKRGYINKFLEETKFGRNFVFKEAVKSVMKLSKGFYPAPLKAIDVIKMNWDNDRPMAMKTERDAFGDLVITDVSKNLIKVFYMSEKYRKLSPKDLKDVNTVNIGHAGVIGAGVMGGGIAQLLSAKGIWTRIKDINYEALSLGLRSANRIYEESIKKRKLTRSEATVKMGYITSTLDYNGFQKSDIVIEAVLEKIDIKKKVFKELSQATHSHCILATNTSALSVTEMANMTKDPSKVIGFHFFNPVHRMPLIEIIITEKTSKETLATTLNFVKRLGKTPIIVKDSPGFVVNRILLAYMSEAGRLLEETGCLDTIDKVMTNFGLPMGPFLLSDEVGLDVGLKVMGILSNAFGERFLPAKIFQDVLNKNLLGRKTGRGFYLHTKKRKVNPQVMSMLDYKEDTIDENKARKRMLLIMINEASDCLDEGVVIDPMAIDVGMIFGTGFPPFRGGLLRYADSLGIDVIIRDLEDLCQELNTCRFKPSAYLRDLNKVGKGFYE